MNTTAIQRPILTATISAINSVYDVPAQPFSVGDCHNEYWQNTGSLAILSLSKLHQLNEAQVLAMFGEAATEVLNNPGGDDHQNIRSFLKVGLGGVNFDGGGICLRPELQLIEATWENRTEFSPGNTPADVVDAINTVIGNLDAGTMRTAMKLGDFWFVNQAIKKAVLLSFRIQGNYIQRMGDLLCYDKVGSKFDGWDEARFEASGFRVVPPSCARKGSFIAKGVVLMNTFVNIGAHVGEGTMLDTWSLAGSCAQIGDNCHISAGVIIGGVLEPLQANPVIIGDNCFIGVNSSVTEGVIVEDNSVIAGGVQLTASTKIFERSTGRITQGLVPAGSVVVPGNLVSEDGRYGVAAAIIIKQVDAQTRSKTSINELLRG